MEPSKQLIDFMIRHEVIPGLPIPLTPYPDPKGQNKEFSIGIGHHILPNENPPITKLKDNGEAYALFNKDINERAKIYVDKLSITIDGNKYPLTQGIYDAFIDMTFNCKRVHILPIYEYLKKGDFKSVIYLWDQLGNSQRRAEGKNLFLLPGIAANPVFQQHFQSQLNASKSRRRPMAKHKSKKNRKVVKGVDAYYALCMKLGIVR